MTYSSWGNACGPCSRLSCRCLQCRLGRGSEARRERASSCQSDNDPDVPRSANPAGRRSRICGATCAWRPSYEGRTHMPRKENRRTEPTTLGSHAPSIPTRSANGVMATREIDATSRVQRGVAQTSRCRGLLIHAPLGRNLDQCVPWLKAVQRHTDCKRQDRGISGPGRFPSVRHSLSSSPHDNRY